MRKLQAKVFLVYAITNSVNGKRYIGITTRPILKRLRCHFSDAKRSKTAIGQAIMKHGKSAFSIEPIACARSWGDLEFLEQQMIVQEDTFIAQGRGYNQTHGGDGGRGNPCSPEQRALLSKMRMGNKHAAGAVRSAEFRAAISTAHKGKPENPASIAKLRATMTGRKLSESHRAAMSAATLGKPRPATPKMLAQVAWLAVFNRGRKASPEERAKRSQSARNSPALMAHLARVREARFGRQKQSE